MSAHTDALGLARDRLRVHLRKVAELGQRGNIPAARCVLDDAASDLNDIQDLLDADGDDDE